jgi:hypothetical protein
VANGNGKHIPWEKILKGGGLGAAMLLLWFMFLEPMRSDFKDFRDSVTMKVDKVASELAAIRELISSDIRQRITRNEQRDEEIMRRLDRLEAERK